MANSWNLWFHKIMQCIIHTLRIFSRLCFSLLSVDRLCFLNSYADCLLSHIFSQKGLTNKMPNEIGDQINKKSLVLLPYSITFENIVPKTITVLLYSLPQVPLSSCS